MKKNLLFGIITLMGGSLLTAYADPKDDVTAAAKKLADGGGNYTCGNKRLTPAKAVSAAASLKGQDRSRPHAGLKLRDSPSAAAMPSTPPPTERLYQGTNSVTKNADGQWQTAAEIAAAAAAQRRWRRFRRRSRRVWSRSTGASTTTTITTLVAGVTELNDDNGTLVGDLTEDAAKANIFPGGRGRGGAPGGGGAPEPTDAKGSVKIWIKDGALVKYEVKNSGKMSFGGGDPIDINRTTTVEFSDVGQHQG